MNNSFTPRVNWGEKTRQWQDYLGGCQASVANDLAKPLLSFCDRSLPSLGRTYFALGWPFEVIRKCFARGAFAGLCAFRRRESNEPVGYWKSTEYHPDGAVKKEVVDPHYGAVDPKNNLAGVFSALCAGEFAMAREISSLAWDPPKAGYIGRHKYAVATPLHQFLAYGLRDYYCGRTDESLKELRRVQPNKPSEQDLKHISGIVIALLQNDSISFLDSLIDLVGWHEYYAAREAKAGYGQESDRDFRICDSGTAMASLAVKLDLISLEDIPKSDFLPRELVSLVQTGELGADNIPLIADDIMDLAALEPEFKKIREHLAKSEAKVREARDAANATPSN